MPQGDVRDGLYCYKEADQEEHVGLMESVDHPFENDSHVIKHIIKHDTVPNNYTYNPIVATSDDSGSDEDLFMDADDL